MSIVVGVLRHGLFDIDVVFRRSAVFAVLWLGIGVLYVAVAATPGLALGGNIPVELAVLLTIGVAVAFQPVRRRLESWADRRVFGRRVDHYEVLRTLGTTLEQSIGLTELMPRLAARRPRGSAAPRWVRVALPGEGATWPPDLRETAGVPDGDPELSQDLRRGGRADRADRVRAQGRRLHHRGPGAARDAERAGRHRHRERRARRPAVRTAR